MLKIGWMIERDVLLRTVKGAVGGELFVKFSTYSKKIIVFPLSFL